MAYDLYASLCSPFLSLYTPTKPLHLDEPKQLDGLITLKCPYITPRYPYITPYIPIQLLYTPIDLYMAGCQNCSPFLGTLHIRDP